MTTPRQPSDESWMPSYEALRALANEFGFHNNPHPDGATIRMLRAVARRAVERDGKAEFWERDGSIRAVVWDGERYVATDEPPVGCLPIESAPPPASESGLAERARDYAAGIRGEVDLRVGWNMAASLLIELADELDRRSVAAPAPQGVDVGQLVSDSWHAIYNCDGPDVCKTLLEHLVRRALGEAK